VSYIFSAILIDGQMHGAKRAASNLLLDGVLIDLEYRSAVI